MDKNSNRKYIVTVVSVIVMTTTLLSSSFIKKFKRYIGFSGEGGVSGSQG